MAEAEASPSSRIFVSYRREDSAGHVLALIPRLRAHFGADRVFKDTDSIAPGHDFVATIQRELESCSVLLAIIGKEWLSIRDPRMDRRRLDNPEDFLRLEVSTALQHETILVIPVLVGRASMPGAQDLPLDLVTLARRNAIELSDIRWDSDLDRLIRAIELVCARADPGPGPVDAPRPPHQPLPHKSTQSQSRELLEARRKRQIEQHMSAARKALAAEDFDEVLTACDKALWLDPNDVEGIALSSRAREALDHQRIADWLRSAQDHLTAGTLAEASELIDQALLLDPAFEDAVRLRQQLLQLRAATERERERARMLVSALGRTRACFEEEDFEGTIQSAEDALAIDSESAEAAQLLDSARTALDERRRERELKRRAQQVVAEVRHGFAQGRHTESLARLEAFTPRHALVDRALQELGAEWDTVEQARAQVELLIRESENSVVEGRFDGAVQALGKAQRLAPDRPEIASLLAQALSTQQAAEAAAMARLAAESRLSEAEEKLGQRDFATAKQLLDEAGRVDPGHPGLSDFMKRIAQQEALQAAVEVARASLMRDDLESATREADRALAVDGSSEEALALKESIAASREEHQRKAAAVAFEEAARAKAARDIADRKRTDTLTAATAERAAAKRLEKERLEKELVEQQRIEKKRAEKASVENDRAARERAAAAATIAAADSLAAAEPAIAESMPPQPEASEVSRLRQERAVDESSSVFQVGQLETGQQLGKKFRIGPIAASVGVVLALAVAWAFLRPGGHQQSGPGAALGGVSVAPAPQLPEAVEPGSRIDIPARVETPAALPPLPAAVPGATVAPAPDSRLARLQQIKTRLRQQLRAGQRSEVLATAEEGLRLEPGDRDILAVIDSILRDARISSQQARQAAVAAGAPADASVIFNRGRETEEAARTRQAAQKTRAIRSFWAAALQFQDAATQSRKVVLERASVPAPVASTPRLPVVAPTAPPVRTAPSVTTTPPVSTAPAEVASGRKMEDEIRGAVHRCVEVLRSNGADRMASLYAASTPQETENRNKLRNLMQRSELRLSVIGEPAVSPPEVRGESAHQDVGVRLAWRRSFGPRADVTVRIRAEIAGGAGDSQITTCRIRGTPDLR